MPYKLLIMLAMLLAQPSTHAKIYKYVDVQGNVVYSQSKPKNTTAQELNPHIQKISPEQATKRLEAIREKAANTEKNRDLLRKGKQDQAAIDKREKDNCEQARKNLVLLQESPRVQATDDKGDLFYLDADGLKAKKAEAQGHITKFCK